MFVETPTTGGSAPAVEATPAVESTLPPMPAQETVTLSPTLDRPPTLDSAAFLRTPAAGPDTTLDRPPAPKPFDTAGSATIDGPLAQNKTGQGEFDVKINLGPKTVSSPDTAQVTATLPETAPKPAFSFAAENAATAPMPQAETGGVPPLAKPPITVESAGQTPETTKPAAAEAPKPTAVEAPKATAEAPKAEVAPVSPEANSPEALQARVTELQAKLTALENRTGSQLTAAALRKFGSAALGGAKRFIDSQINKSEIIQTLSPHATQLVDNTVREVETARNVANAAKRVAQETWAAAVRTSLEEATKLTERMEKHQQAGEAVQNSLEVKDGKPTFALAPETPITKPAAAPRFVLEPEAPKPATAAAKPEDQPEPTAEKPAEAPVDATVTKGPNPETAQKAPAATVEAAPTTPPKPGAKVEAPGVTPEAKRPAAERRRTEAVPVNAETMTEAFAIFSDPEQMKGTADLAAFIQKNGLSTKVLEAKLTKIHGAETARALATLVERPSMVKFMEEVQALQESGVLTAEEVNQLITEKLALPVNEDEEAITAAEIAAEEAAAQKKPETTEAKVENRAEREPKITSKTETFGIEPSLLNRISHDEYLRVLAIENSRGTSLTTENINYPDVKEAPTGSFAYDGVRTAEAVTAAVGDRAAYNRIVGMLALSQTAGGPDKLGAFTDDLRYQFGKDNVSVFRAGPTGLIQKWAPDVAMAVERTPEGKWKVTFSQREVSPDKKPESTISANFSFSK